MITAACSDLQLTTNAVVCHFRVSSVVCGHTGNPSPPLSVTLKGIHCVNCKLIVTDIRAMIII